MSVLNDICFDIISSKDITKDEEKKIDKHIKNLYSNPDNKEHIPKRKAGDYPYALFFPPGKKKVCFLFKGEQKNAKKTHKTISDNLSKDDLKISKNIKLKGPIYPKEAEKITTDILKKKKGWTTLSHQGPEFTYSYTPHNKPILYKGKKIHLSSKSKTNKSVSEEEAATFYAHILLSEKSGTSTQKMSKDEVFNKNFWNDFQKILSKENKNIIKDFKHIDFSPIVKHLEKVKEEKKVKSQKEKEKELREKKEKESLYTIIVDGRTEKVDKKIEPPGVFKGRGDKPIRGAIKEKTTPDDVGINIGPEAIVPKPPKRTTWNSVVHDHDAIWMFRYKSNVTGKMVYGYSGRGGIFKAQGDYQKFENARELNKVIDTVRKIYYKDLHSNSKEKQQLATIVYLVDFHALRIGGKHDEDKDANTIGASTIPVKGATPTKENGKYLIKFDFLGKDSIPYQQTVKVDEIIYNRFKEFMKGKKKDDPIFDLASSMKVNEYLKSIAKKVNLSGNLTAKVFRTRAASYLFNKKIKKIEKSDNITKLKLELSEANEDVAKQLNHVKSETIKGKESFQKAKDKVKDFESEIKKQQTQKKKGKLSDKEIQQLKKKEERLKIMKTQLKIRATGRQTAKGTSKMNYIDPRIYLSWAKRNKVDLNKIKFYSATDMRNFKWAIDSIESSKNWKY